MLSREKIEAALRQWHKAWADHDLDGVMALFHEDVLFENWTGGKAEGRDNLRRAWSEWFVHHGGFRSNEIIRENYYARRSAARYSRHHPILFLDHCRHLRPFPVGHDPAEGLILP
jgi:hypothetical protein